MIPIGHSSFGKYRLWIAPPIFTVERAQDGDADTYAYYEVLLIRLEEWRTTLRLTEGEREDNHLHYYVDVNNLLSLNLSERNPMYGKVFPAKSKDSVVSSPEEIEFRDEYQAYQSRKAMGMPLWKLSRKHVHQLIDALNLETGDDAN